ncbi:glycosyltransferase [Polynucleobacter paneuropaeus]|nr:glycosyltransferase [Polynucleobacter paneuropaeus]QWD09501.1 glycosyltransferase [Polynucleobacter paneuropaeus]
MVVKSKCSPDKVIKYSIIIPVKELNDYIRETVPHIQSLSSNNWELLIIPNESSDNEWVDERIKIAASGRVGPAAKRDLGGKIAQGEILVFLDDDSYPNPNLLEVASFYFDDHAVVAIGGAAITPPGDSFWQKVSGAVYLSKYSGGNPERYMPIGEVKVVDDWPSVNFMVRRNEFLAVGGFNSPYWPGEDTWFCMDLIKKTGKKILYVPKLVVWHHRREGIAAHLKQVGAYGLHRGYFARKYRGNSLKFRYFLPSIWVLFLVFAFISALVGYWGALITLIFIIYFIAIALAIREINKYCTYLVSVASLPYILLTHVCYGFQFLRGFGSKELISKMR